MSVKNLWIVAASIIIAGAIIGMMAHHQPQVAAQGPAPVPAQVGRYQIAGIPGHAYVLDTATGQVWEAYAGASGGATDQNFKVTKLKAQP